MEQAEAKQVRGSNQSLYVSVSQTLCLFQFLLLKKIVHLSGVYKPVEHWQIDYKRPPAKKRNASAVFTLKEMEEATCHFSDENLLGKGGFGRVYKGTLRSGEVCSIFLQATHAPLVLYKNEEVLYRTGLQFIFKM